MELKHTLILGILLHLNFTYCQIILDGLEYCQLNPPWVKYRGSCYLFHQDWKARVSFYDAEDDCRGRGGHLASIHSEEENNFFLDMSMRGVFRGRQWIGLNILKGNDTPEWTDGTPVNYTKLIPKEFYKNEKCFMFMKEKKGWRPEDCGLHYPPICKRPADVTPITIPPPTTIPPPEGHCQKDWIQFGQKCYKYFGEKEKDRLSYKQAKEACWALGKGHDLVSIHSMKEQAFLTQHLYSLNTSAWIGMQKLDSDEIGHDLVFGWVDNSRVDFTFWTSGHPPPGTWKYCSRLSNETVSAGEWIADYCDIKKIGYICQSSTDPSLPKPDPEPSKCDSSSIGFRDSCYQYFSKPETQAKAEQSCNKIGGHLVSISDSFEQSFLYNLIDELPKFVWNGLASVQGTHYLKWTDNQPVYYTNWNNGQPKFNSTKKACSLLDVTNDLKWQMANCSLELPYVCEITDGVAPSFPEVLGNCTDEDPWIDIGDKFCYHLGNTKNYFLSWDSTFRYCTSKGLQMVKTYSDHQINSLVAYLWKENKTINLGMIRKFDKSSFIWIDGTPLEYLNWDIKEPSNYPEDRGCVAFSQKTGKWRTIPCSEGGVVLCQSLKR